MINIASVRRHVSVGAIPNHADREATKCAKPMATQQFTDTMNVFQRLPTHECRVAGMRQWSYTPTARSMSRSTGLLSPVTDFQRDRKEFLGTPASYPPGVLPIKYGIRNNRRKMAIAIALIKNPIATIATPLANISEITWDNSFWLAVAETIV
jgi:hypothetical protein